ncbi:MAG: outer membrane protein assembly factor BamB [Planctomycetota bacterium]|jgi:outer membrane protein assembly factor BamB
MKRAFTPLALFLLTPAAWAQGSQELGWFGSDAGDVNFGNSTAMSANHLVVGDPGHTENGIRSGSVFLFDAITMAQQFELLPNDGDAEDYFGSSVAIRNSIVLAGAPSNDDAGIRSGSAYTFDPQTGMQLHKLVAADASANQYFGTSVAIAGSIGVVGAPSYDSIGSAYVFDLTTGAQIVKLQASDGEAQDQFGVAVAIDGNRVLVGAPADDDNGLEAGAVYVFDATNGVELAKWHASDGVANARFGRAVASRDGRALIGAPSMNGGQGATYLFDNQAGVEIARLQPNSAYFPAGIGAAVALHDGLAVIGAPHTETKYPVWWSGAIHLFEAETGMWLEEVTPSFECLLSEGLFGHAVATHGRRSLIGAPGCIGLAYLFDNSLTGATRYCEGSSCPCANNDTSGGCMNSTSSGARIELAGSTSLSADNLILTAESLPAHQFCLFYRGTLATNNAFGDGLRCAGGLTVRMNPPQDSGPAGTVQVGPGLVAQACQVGVGSCLQVGQSWHFQAWYRDPLGPCGTGFSTSDAVSIVLSP